jgi:hypothetical protein
MKTILDDIPFQADRSRLQKQLRIREGSSYVARLDHFAAEAEAIARPKVLYRVLFIDAKTEDSVTLAGITFQSRVLRVNLEQAHRVFAYVATCGTELAHWSESQEDFLLRHWADTIEMMAVRAAVSAMDEHIRTVFRPGELSSMSPGRLEDWPLSAQRDLFRLLGDPQGEIGVRLMPSLWMTPSKSVSGVRFPAKESFESCQLCPREDCPGRRMPYDAGLYERRFAAATPA